MGARSKCSDTGLTRSITRPVSIELRVPLKNPGKSCVNILIGARSRMEFLRRFEQGASEIFPPIIPANYISIDSHGIVRVSRYNEIRRLICAIKLEFIRGNYYN